MMMIQKLALSASVLAAIALVLACGEKQVAAPERGSPAALTPEVRMQAQRALGAYERIRGALAADEHGPQVPEAGRELASAAEAAASAAPAALRPHLSAMAREARELAALSASDLGALRSQFGELSRAVLALLTEESSLAVGLHAFECPMAEGYGRWVQPSAEVSNPYMGTRMPSCGAPSEMDPGGGR